MARAADRQIVALGRSWTLRFSLKALGALQEHFGLETLDGLQAAMARLSAADVAAILWAGLRSHHPEVTQQQALDMADEIGLDAALEVIGAGFSASMPAGGDKAGEGGENPRTPGRQTG